MSGTEDMQPGEKDSARISDVLFKYVPGESVRTSIGDQILSALKDTELEKLECGSVGFDELCSATETCLDVYNCAYEHELRAAQEQLESEARNVEIYRRTVETESKRIASNAVSSVGKFSNYIVRDSENLIEIGEALRSALQSRERLTLARFVTEVWETLVTVDRGGAGISRIASILETKGYRSKRDFSDIVTAASIILPMSKRERIPKVNQKELTTVMEGYLNEIESIFESAEGESKTDLMAKAAGWHRKLSVELEKHASNLHEKFILRSLEPIQLVLDQQNYSQGAEIALKQTFAAAKAIIASRSSLIEKVFEHLERTKVEQMLTTQLFTNQSCGIATAIHQVLGVPILWADENDFGSSMEGERAGGDPLERKLELLAWAYNETVVMSKSLQIDPEYVMNAAEALFAPYRKLYSSKEIHWVESYAASAVTTVQSRKPTALASQPSVLAANYTEDELNEIQNIAFESFNRSSRRCLILLRGTERDETFMRLYECLCATFEDVIFGSIFELAGGTTAMPSNKRYGVGQSGAAPMDATETKMLIPLLQMTNDSAFLFQNHYSGKVCALGMVCNRPVLPRVNRTKDNLLLQLELSVDAILRAWVHAQVQDIDKNFAECIGYDAFTGDATPICIAICKGLTKICLDMERMVNGKNFVAVKILLVSEFFAALVKHVLSHKYTPLQAQQLKWDLQIYEQHTAKLFTIFWADFDLRASPNCDCEVQNFLELRRLIDILIVNDNNGAKNLLKESPLVEIDPSVLKKFLNLRRGLVMCF